VSRRSRQEAEETARRRRLFVIGSIVAGVVIAAVIAVVATSGGGGDSGTKVATGSQNRPVTVDGASLPPYSSSGADPAVGTAIPTISGQSFDGAPVKIEPNNGKAKVLLGVAHWCPHCQREVPLLSDSIRSDPLPANVEMIAISTSVQPNADNYPPETWLEREHWPTPVMADDSKQTAAHAIGLTGFPYFVFVDAQGKVTSRSSGEMPIDQFRATVDKLAAGGA